MPDTFSADELLDFLTHASERGLIPVSTARAIAVAARNVLAVLTDEERQAVPVADIDAVIRRFVSKRARDLTPDSLKEYGQRVKRAVALYTQWRDDPADFSVKVRSTAAARKRARPAAPTDDVVSPAALASSTPSRSTAGDGMASAYVGTGVGYETKFPVRPGHLVTLGNVPHDLSAAEARRFARFVEQLSAEAPDGAAGHGRPA